MHESGRVRQKWGLGTRIDWFGRSLLVGRLPRPSACLCRCETRLLTGSTLFGHLQSVSVVKVFAKAQIFYEQKLTNHHASARDWTYTSETRRLEGCLREALFASAWRFDSRPTIFQMFYEQKLRTQHANRERVWWKSVDKPPTRCRLT